MILGLDVSTSTVGYCVLDQNTKRFDRGRVVSIHAIDLTKEKEFWSKVDELERRLSCIRADHGTMDAVIVEEPLMRFAAGMSSASTISTLMRFNGITCHLVRKTFGVDPTMLSAATARKACGVRLLSRSKAGSQKDQVFNHMCAADLKDVVWPRKRGGNVVDWAKDATDAYVIATGHIELNTTPPDV